MVNQILHAAPSVLAVLTAELLDPVDRLLVDESPVPAGEATVLVVGSPALAGAALAAGAGRVLGFCDSASEHLALPQGVERLTPDQPLPPVDVAWVRLGRDLDELDQWSGWVAASGAAMVAGARTKHLNPGMNNVLRRHFAEVRASRGRDKARVLHASSPLPGAVERPGGAWPRWGEVEVDHRTMRVARHGGTFASGRLDPGTRLLLEQLDELITPAPGRVLDWGSGAGIISTALAHRLPAARIDAVDLSWAGFAATNLTVAENQASQVGVHWADGNALLAQLGPFDLVVSNPPFHAGVAKDSTATLAMIDAAAEALAPGGELWLVHNSHLPWLRHMRRHGPAGVVVQNTGYTVSRLRLP